MSIEQKITECSGKIKKLKPGEAFIMSFEIGFYDKTIIDASVMSLSSKKIKSKKEKCFKKFGKCCREKYIGKNKNEIRDKLCTNANLIVQGSVLATKIVKILENLKNTKNSLFSSQERTNTNIPTDGYSLKNSSSNYRNNFFEYKDILSPERTTNSHIYDNIDRVKDRIYDKNNMDSSLTPTTDSFYTSYDRSSKQQSHVTTGSGTTKTTTTTMGSTESKTPTTIPNSVVTNAPAIPANTSKCVIKPISPRLNRKIAKLVLNEEKKRRKNGTAKLKDTNGSPSKLATSSNIKNEIGKSQLDLTQKEKQDSVFNSAPTSSANTAISINEKSSINGDVINKTKNVNDNISNKKPKQDLSSTASINTAESPTNTKNDSKDSSVSTTSSTGAITAISIKDLDINTAASEKKNENPEISSNAVQSNASSVQTARLPPHIQNQQTQNLKTNAL
ncbi:Hypothetical protein SRAE_2000158700 [Strongyloides ratti]|uniref:Uncharacterized protein n=1 Tax=Strongyloides ratti TaxID=34506 RepID=A0A090LAV0_STRRB|nr:Hypothetical protein SRAE_2000158700 [Strongyloides ratti]CEF66921.1 Hypothetical protein SRAE_2000158700 [Strongyloides ratti]